MVTPATVLVVDDHEANLSGLRAFLQRDYSVMTTTSGNEAIRIWVRQGPGHGFRTGQPVMIQLTKSKVHCFDRVSGRRLGSVWSG